MAEINPDIAEYQSKQTGDYILEVQLGSPMSHVWKARHRFFGNVVIKPLLSLSKDPILGHKLLGSDKRTAFSPLHHSNIVAPVAVLRQGDHVYLVEPYIDSESLESKLTKQGGPLPLNDVRAISLNVLSALNHAHSLGVMHGSVRSAKVLLDESGHVWVIDFELVVSEKQKLSICTRVDPLYMSPEQIMLPASMDARSDLYSFGCVLYEMLSGATPFGADPGSSIFDIHDCHVRKAPPPLRQRNPAISTGLEEVVMRCLEKDPNDRFSNCGEAMKLLDAAMSS